MKYRVDLIDLDQISYQAFAYRTQRKKENLQVDPLNIAVCFLYLVKSDMFSVHMYRSAEAYTGQVNSTQKNTAMFKWSLCKTLCGRILN